MSEMGIREITVWLSTNKLMLNQLLFLIAMFLGAGTCRLPAQVMVNNQRNLVFISIKNSSKGSITLDVTIDSNSSVKCFLQQNEQCGIAVVSKLQLRSEVVAFNFDNRGSISIRAGPQVFTHLYYGRAGIPSESISEVNEETFKEFSNLDTYFLMKTKSEIKQITVRPTGLSYANGE